MISTDELKALLEKATKGPWYAMHDKTTRAQGMSRVYATDDELRFVAHCQDSMNISTLTDNNANAELIALAPELAARIIALDQAIGMLEELVACQPEVHSGRARDPQDDVHDMIEHRYLTDLQYDARKVLKDLGVIKP